MAHRTITIAILSAALLTGAWACSFEARSGDFACTSQQDCFDGRECSMGWCVLPGVVSDNDAAPPTIDAAPGAPDAAPSFASAPLPVIAMSPAAGDVDTTFSANASGTSDLEDAAATLTYSWDWENDGTFDDTGISATHSYALPGAYTVVLRAEDPGGLQGYKSFRLIVAAAADLVTVTTGLDESDANATPMVPGGTGLSLREAIDFTNATAGRQLIFVPSGTVTSIGSQLPALDDALGADLVGDGATIDGSVGTGSACLVTGGDDNTILGLELRNCKGDAFRDANGSTSTLVSRCLFHDSPTAVRANGNALVLGPDNEVFAHTGNAIDLASETTIVGNTIRDNATSAIFVASSASGSVIRGNQIYANGIGVSLNTNASSVVLHHNTIDGNAQGITASASNVVLTDLRNNIISNSTGFGLTAGNANFAERDHNDFYANASGDCSACAVSGTGSSTAKPQFIDQAGADYRLRPTSPLIDAATDLGIDVNGPASGLFNGSAPDIGAHESP